MGKASRKKALRRAGIGDYKLSEALIELVDPMLSDDLPFEARQSLFLVASIAWNVAIFPTKLRARQILNFIGGLPELPGDIEAEIGKILEGQESSAEFPPEKLEMLNVLVALIARKDELYPHDRRLIGDVELQESNGQYRLQVASKLAPSDFGDGEA